MFRIICNHQDTSKKQRFGGFISKVVAENYCLILGKRGYFGFKITEYTPTPIKTGTSKSRAIKVAFSCKF